MVDVPVRQSSVSDVIDDALTADFNVRVSVLAETGRGLVESTESVASNVEIMLLATNSQARQVREPFYTNSPTHECYMPENEHFLAGRTIIVTAYRSADGTWEDESDGPRYQILGGERQYGVSAPRDHIRYDLSRITKGV